jgi:hypothetical protein
LIKLRRSTAVVFICPLCLHSPVNLPNSLPSQFTMSNQPSGGRQIYVSGFPTQISGFVPNPRQDSSTTPLEELSSKNDSRISSPLPERPKNAKFAFIHHTGPTVKDRESKRLIKKHVMIDIGKSRRKQPSTRKRYQQSTDDLASDQSRDLKQIVQGRDMERRALCVLEHDLPPISRFSTTRDPFTAYPIKMTRRTRALVDHGQLFLSLND